jgi:general secretion pathway protein A
MAIAWRELALRWQVAIGEGDACTAAAQARLACYRSIAGGLPIVRQLQRPGLIALHAPGSEGSASGFAVLVSLGQRQATLVAAGRRFVLDLPTLASVWRGDFATFWRMPPGWDEGVDGVGGQRTAEWLDSRLAAAGVRTPGPLRSRVRDFQVAQGLPADGVPGPVTLMQLNRAVGVVEPSLEPGR